MMTTDETGLNHKANSLLAALFAAVLIAGCGGGGGDSPADEVPAPAPGPAAPAPIAGKTSYSLLKESGLAPQPTRSTFDAARTYLDVDGDGTLEVFSAQVRYNPATTTPETAPLSVFRFLRKQANGSLVEDPALLPGGNQGCVHPRKAVLSDFNADGRMDVFVACHGYDAAPFPGERSKVVLSQPNGTYVIRDANDKVGFFHSAAAADFNGDGHNDVVMTDSSTDPSIKVWLNDGTGQFTPTADYVPMELRRRANFFTVDVPDVDGDGKFDLIVAGHEWENARPTVYINPGNADFSSVVGAVVPAVAAEGVVLDVVVTGSGIDRAIWLLRTSGGDGTFYQSLVVQQVLWPSQASSVPLSRRPAQWQPWMIPAEVGGVRKLVSDDAAVTSIDISYGTTAPAAPAANKYQGTWALACSRFESDYETETFSLTTRANDLALTGQYVKRTYANSTCSGAPATTETFDLSITIDGETSAVRAGQSYNFDKVTILATGIDSVKWLMTVLPNGQMVIDFGDNGMGSSTTSYPVDPNEGEAVYVRQ